MVIALVLAAALQTAPEAVADTAPAPELAYTHVRFAVGLFQGGSGADHPSAVPGVLLLGFYLRGGLQAGPLGFDVEAAAGSSLIVNTLRAGLFVEYDFTPWFGLGAGPVVGLNRTLFIFDTVPENDFAAGALRFNFYFQKSARGDVPRGVTLGLELDGGADVGPTGQLLGPRWGAYVTIGMALFPEVD